jgi:hypothetical protein
MNRLIITTLFFLAAVPIIFPNVVLAAGPNISQTHFRFRNDDGSETGATWNQNEDINITGFSSGTTIRLRIQDKNTGTPASNAYWFLAYQAGTSCTGTTGWTLVGTSSAQAFNLVTSTNFNDLDPTTAQLTNPSSTFNPGFMLEATNPYSTTTPTKYFEYEWSLQATNQASPGTTYAFRISGNGNFTGTVNSSLNTYSVCPNITMAPAPSTPDMGIVTLFGDW